MGVGPNRLLGRHGKYSIRRCEKLGTTDAVNCETTTRDERHQIKKKAQARFCTHTEQGKHNRHHKKKQQTQEANEQCVGQPPSLLPW